MSFLGVYVAVLVCVVSELNMMSSWSFGRGTSRSSPIGNAPEEE